MRVIGDDFARLVVMPLGPVEWWCRSDDGRIDHYQEGTVGLVHQHRWMALHLAVLLAERVE